MSTAVTGGRERARGGSEGSRALNRGRLARDLSQVVQGEVSFGPGARAMYANDASIYRQVPVGVVAPRRTARVQPGVICDHLRAEAGGHGLTFAVDPATHDHCTLGGRQARPTSSLAHSVPGALGKLGARVAGKLHPDG